VAVATAKHMDSHKYHLEFGEGGGGREGHLGIRGEGGG